MTIPSNAVQSNGVGVLTGDQMDTFVQTDQSVVQLREFIGITGMAVMLQGITAPGDGGAGLFYWSNGTFTDNGISTIVPSGATGIGAWLRAGSGYPVLSYTVAGLPSVTSANAGQQAYATNGRANASQGSGAGLGTPVYVNSAGTWCATWSGVAITS